MWYLNPKNILMIILGVAIAGIGTAFLFQRATIATIEGENKQLMTDNLVQAATIGGLNRNIKAIEAHQQRVQVIEHNTQTVREIVREIKPGIALGGNCNDLTPEEKQKIQDGVAAAVTLFNTGMYTKPGDSAPTKEVLPPPAGTEIDNADKRTASYSQ